MKKLFTVLNYTWGIVNTILGLFVALSLIIAGKRPKIRNGCFFFEVGNGWGSFSLGTTIVTGENPRSFVLQHEYGHTVQNAMFGVFNLFIVTIPSLVRAAYRSALCIYDGFYDIWFEAQASELGKKYLSEG